MPIKVHYFAQFRELAKCEYEEIQFAGTLSDLYNHVANKHGFKLPADMIQVACNDEFTLMTSSIVPGSKIVFIPPVAGG